MKTKIGSWILYITAGWLLASCAAGGRGVSTTSPDRSTQLVAQIPAEGGRKIPVTESR